MAKTKEYLNMESRTKIKVIYPSRKSQKKARKLVRIEFSPQVTIESDVQKYLVTFCKNP